MAVTKQCSISEAFLLLLRVMKGWSKNRVPFSVIQGLNHCLLKHLTWSRWPAGRRCDQIRATINQSLSRRPCQSMARKSATGITSTASIRRPVGSWLTTICRFKVVSSASALRPRRSLAPTRPLAFTSIAIAPLTRKSTSSCYVVRQKFNVIS